MYSGFASPERESDQRPVNSASGGRIATPVCALARNDRIGCVNPICPFMLEAQSALPSPGGEGARRADEVEAPSLRSVVQIAALTPHPSRPSREIGASHLPLEGEGFGLSSFLLNAVQNREEPFYTAVYVAPR